MKQGSARGCGHPLPLPRLPPSDDRHCYRANATTTVGPADGFFSGGLLALFLELHRRCLATTQLDRGGRLAQDLSSCNPRKLGNQPWADCTNHAGL